MSAGGGLNGDILSAGIGTIAGFLAVPLLLLLLKIGRPPEKLLSLSISIFLSLN